MKLLMLIWIIAAMVLMIFGWGWILVDKNNEKHKKAQYIVLAVSSFMLAVYFIVFLVLK